MLELSTFVRQLSVILPPKWRLDPENKSPQALSSWCKKIQFRCRADVDRLWVTYNTGRENLNTRTVADAKSVSAYLVGFHPFQWLRAHGVLQRSIQRHPEVFSAFKKGYDCIDLGCGTGAISSAADSCLGRAERWLGVDLSKPALLASSTGSKAKQKKTVKASLHDFSFDRYFTQEGRPLLVCLGYTANEMRGRIGQKFYETLIAAISNLKAKRPVVLVWLEPAMETQAIAMHQTREQARLNGLSTLYPCPHQEICPMGIGEFKSQKDRCYSEVGTAESKLVPQVLFHGAPTAVQDRSRLGVSGYIFTNFSDQPTLDKATKDANVLVGRPRERNGNKKILICDNTGKIRKRAGSSPKLRGQLI